MVVIQVSQETYQQLRERAEKAGRSIEDVILESLKTPSLDEIADIEKNIHLILSNPKSETRQKIYALCRKYWLENHDYERLTMSDQTLDENFWLIDPQGIPRFKSEQGQIEIPPDPYEDLIGLVDSDDSNLASRVRETLAENTHPRYGWTKSDRTD